MSTPPSAQSPPQPKPRKKRPADVVTFEDLLAAHKTERGPGQLPAEGVVLIGVDLELQRRMAERRPFPAPQEQNAGAPQLDAPNFPAPALISQQEVKDTSSCAPNVSAPSFSAPTDLNGSEVVPALLREDNELRFSAPQLSAPDFSAPEFNLQELLIRRSGTKTYAVHPVSRIEDVFTPAERDLLRWLWERARPVPINQQIRLMTGPNGEGARRLAIQAGLIYNTFKNLTRSLSTKFAVDIVKPEKNLPAIYAVYHYRAILERQRQAGFSGVVHKNGGGRELVDAEAQPASRRPDLTINELEQILGARKFGTQNSSAHAPNFRGTFGQL